MKPRVVGANRSELVYNLFPKNGAVAEIGVQRGRFAREIRDLTSPSQLFLIDCWKWLPGEYERDPANRPDNLREEEYQECFSHFGKDPRAMIFRMMSHEAAPQFQDGSLDAVYLDADHTFAGVCQDLELWYPKVKPGGIFAGDDYIEGKSWIEVVPAVNQFVERMGLELMVSEGMWPAWAVRKPA